VGDLQGVETCNSNEKRFKTNNVTSDEVLERLKPMNEHATQNVLEIQ